MTVLSLLLLLLAAAAADESNSTSAAERTTPMELTTMGVPPTPVPTRPLRVLVNPVHPFAFQLDDGSWDGFSYELFDSIARRNGWTYTLERVASVPVAVGELKAGTNAVCFAIGDAPSLRDCACSRVCATQAHWQRRRPKFSAVYGR